MDDCDDQNMEILLSKLSRNIVHKNMIMTNKGTARSVFQSAEQEDEDGGGNLLPKRSNCGSQKMAQQDEDDIAWPMWTCCGETLA